MRLAPSNFRHFFWAEIIGLSATARPVLRLRQPLVLPVRWRTVAKVLLIADRQVIACNHREVGLDVRMCFQYSAGKSWKASSTSRSLVSFPTALSYFTP